MHTVLDLLWTFGLRLWLALCLAGLVLVAVLVVVDVHREGKGDQL